MTQTAIDRRNEVVDFGKLAADAKAAHDAKAADEARARDARSLARKRIVDAGIAVLEGVVTPILDRAASEFRQQRIEAVIERDYDVLNFMAEVPPTISFRLLGPKRPSDGYQYKTLLVAFGSLGAKIDIFATQDSTSRRPSRPHQIVDIAEAEDAIGKAVELTLVDYFKTMNESPISWM